MEPSVIWAGYWFFFFPGLILFIAPSWFFYSTALAFVAFLLRDLGRMRWLVAILLLALPAFSIPYIANRGTFHQAEEFIKDDTDVSSPIELSRSTALANSVFPTLAALPPRSCPTL